MSKKDYVMADMESEQITSPIEEVTQTEGVVDDVATSDLTDGVTNDGGLEDAMPDEGVGVTLENDVSSDMSAGELEQLQEDEPDFSWDASEYVQHHKGVAWYVGLTGILVILLLLAIWLKFWLSIAVFVAMGAALYVYAHKSPRVLQYVLTPKGITIDGREHLYEEFRSFGVIPDTEWHMIDLDPVRRFSPKITVLFDTEDFDEIVGHLGLHLPRVDRKPDLVERISRYLRF